MTVLPDRVRIVEVGPRDGLQNERKSLSTDEKVRFIAKLVDAGLTSIEATSFVHPKVVPQLADAADLLHALPEAPGVTFSALVPNERGLDRAIESGVKRIAVFTAASETFTKKNIGMTIDESLQAFKPVVQRAIAAGMTVRGYVSTCFVCPYEGEIDKQRVGELAKRLVDLGVDEVANTLRSSDLDSHMHPLIAAIGLGCCVDAVTKIQLTVVYHVRARCA